MPFLPQAQRVRVTLQNLALCWLLRNAKDVGRLGRWILLLEPFKFKVKHTRGVDNLVADGLSCMFDGNSGENVEVTCGALLESLPLVYSSLKEQQENDVFCMEVLKKIQDKQTGVENFQVHKGLLCYFLKRSKRRRYVVPPVLRPMLLKYFHDAVLATLLVAWKTYHRVASNFWWQKMRIQVFYYVSKLSCFSGPSPRKTCEWVYIQPALLLYLWIGCLLILWVHLLEPNAATSPFWSWSIRFPSSFHFTLSAR